MKNVSAILLLFFAALACKNKSSADQGSSNLDAARDFIRAALDGKFDEARQFVLSDSANQYYMDLAERSYNNQDKATKDGYRASSIHIHEVKSPNDSTTMITYSNSYMNKPTSLKVVKVKDKWWVDFKYLYEHTWDSIQHTNVNKDSVK